MGEQKTGRNDPCPCGSGKKFKVCCLDKRPSGLSMEQYSVRQPLQVYGEMGREWATPKSQQNGTPRSVMPKVRVEVDYTFQEEFGKADVFYLFSVSRTIVLENGNVIWVEFLKPGMRMKLEDGGVATVTKVSPPKIVMAPSDKEYEGGLKEKRILGTIKRTGFVVMDLVVGGMTIATTPGHPFYSVTRREFVPAGELSLNELLRNDRGGSVPLQAKGQPRYGLVEMYNVEVEDFHTFFVGTPGNAVWVHNGLEGLCSVVKPLGQEEAAQLSENVLFRQVKGDHKGRPFGQPTNPKTPTVADLNPKVAEIKAGDLESAIVGRKHGLDPRQAGPVSQMSNEELLKFRVNDPMSGNLNVTGDGFSITGGHHRLAEIIQRVKDGRLPADTPIRILFHD